MLVGGMAGQARAQTFSNRYNFPDVVYDSTVGFYTNSAGAYPDDRFVLAGTSLYGTASSGGNFGQGTIFKVNTDGTGFTVVHQFTARTFDSSLGIYTNSDGVFPYAGLILSNNTLYGTAIGGGSSQNGTVFRVNTDGTGFTNLHSFTATHANNLGFYTNSDGANPYAGLILSGSTLYGTTANGGSSANGAVFAVNTDGTGFTNLHSLAATLPPGFTNSEGANPYSGLILSGGTLYGTAAYGGSLTNGTVFAMSTNGTGFTTLHTFTNATDGGWPLAGLILLDNALYGTTSIGGSSSQGTVFKVNTNGTGFSNLHNFTAGDGTHPQSDLIAAGNTLYGMALGGSAGGGTVFAVNTDSTGFTNLYQFTAYGTNSSGFFTNSDGAYPYAGVVLSSNTLYGMTYYGGRSGNGTFFSLQLPAPKLNIARATTNVILSWPANAVGFTLQATTNLAPTVVWTAVAPAPVVLNAQNIVTNPISGTQKFYRLSQ